MIITESILISADNAGPKKVKCLKLCNNVGNSRIMKLGQEIIVAIQKKRVKFRKKILDKKIFLGIIISTRSTTRRIDSSTIKFSKNRSLLMNSEFRYLGTRVYGPICKEIRNTKSKELKYKRIISYSSYTV
jgi:large subunit ribosomal protein L14